MTQIEIDCRLLQLNNELRHYQNSLDAFKLNKAIGNNYPDSLIDWTKEKIKEVKLEIAALVSQ